MKLHKRIQVEPLDEERLTNIERRLVIATSVAPQVRAPRRPFALVTFAVATAIAVLIGWTLHRSIAPSPTIAASHALAVVEPAQHVAVSTEAERTTLALDDATIASDPASAFDVVRGGGRVVVEMTRGKLDLVVQHRPGRVFVIRAGDTEIEDVGTRFSVAYDGTTVDVRVSDGEVKITRAQQVTRVAAGSAWTSTRGLVAIADLEAVPAPIAPVVAVAPHVTQTPVAVAVATPTHIAPRSRVAAIEPAPARVAAAPVDPYVELRTAIRAQPIAFDPKVDGKLDASNEIARLKLLAYSPNTVGAEASAALYRIAVLLHRPLGQDAAALNTLELYRRRFAGGTERVAAMWLRVRIACGHTIDEECRSAAYSYQREVPTGEAADVAIRITNAQ